MLVLVAAAVVVAFTSRPRTLDALGVPLEQCVKLEVTLSNGYDHLSFCLTPDDPKFKTLLALFQDRTFETFPIHPKELAEDTRNFIEAVQAPIGGLFPQRDTWQITFSTEDGSSWTAEGCEGRLKLIKGDSTRRMGTAGQLSWFRLVWNRAEKCTDEKLKPATHWIN